MKFSGHPKFNALGADDNRANILFTMKGIKPTTEKVKELETKALTIYHRSNQECTAI